MTDELIDIIEDVPELVGMPPMLALAGIFLAAGVGVAIGYAIGAKRTTLKYEAVLEQQVQDAKEFYARRYKADEFETPEQAAEKLGVSVPPEVNEAVARYRGENDSPPVGNANINRNIFETVANWDQEVEQSKRDAQPLEPYVISKDEWIAADPGYNQISLTYFVEDDLMIDDKDEPVPDMDNTVGIDNLSRFGHGSGDNRIVYVRNDQIEADFEVVRSEGSYNKEVLGFDDRELKHADRRPRRASRRADE